MIRVFDKHTKQGHFRNTSYTNFDTLGTVINPISAYITEELNGEYSYEVVCPILPDDDSWKSLAPYNIIKSTTGQLFQIIKLKYETVNGVPCVKAYAPHIWYYLSDMHVSKYERSDTPYWHVDHIMTDPYNDDTHYGTIWSDDPQLTNYHFDYSVDVDFRVDTLKFNHVSIAYALLGSPDSVINTTGAYLYRDNFRFSINKRLEGSKDNAFYLNVADNCSEIKYTWDYSDRCTTCYSWDQNGNVIKWFFGLGDGFIAHHTIIGAEYALTEFSDFEKEAKSYFDTYCWEKRTYEVNFVDSNNTERDSGWEQIRMLRVGDSGIICDLKGDTDTQTIISVKYNDITKRIDSMKLGKFIHSDLHETRWDKVLSGDSAAFRRLNVDESRIKNLEDNQGFFKLVKGE